MIPSGTSASARQTEEKRPAPPGLPDTPTPVSEIVDDGRAARRPRAITRTLLERIAAHVGLEVYFHYRLAEGGSALLLESCAGVPADDAKGMERLELDELIGGPVASPAASIVAEEIQRSADPKWARLRSLGLHAFVSYPLLADGDLVGLLAFGTGRRPRFAPGELELLRAVSDQVTLTLELGRLLERVGAHERQRVEEANRARDEFLTALSHELRTPLNVMLGWVRMLRSPGLDPAQAAHALQVIERNISAETELLNEVLDVSRIVGGTLVFDMRPLDLLPVLEAAVDAVRRSADAKGVELQSRLGGWPLRTVADGARLHQAVASLLANAVQFTPTGGQIIIRLERGADRVRVIVSDTGEGIAPEALPDIFDRDRRRARSSTRAHGGLGLGLTLVRRVVELHGGVVDAASAGVGRGATFTVELPLRRPEQGSRPIGGAEPAEGGDGRLDLLRVLVVDDHADTRELLSVILNERGATVVTARSVAEAYPLLTRFGPDVVLCDISMPGEDGFRLLDWVKTDTQRQSRPIPVVALTAHARPEDRHRILSAGFKAYLPKPLELSDVISVVRSVTGLGPRGSAERAP